MRHLVCLVLPLVFAAPAAAADDAAPGMVYAQSAKFDKSFNEAAFTGAERFEAEEWPADLAGQTR
jgi:basic membrane protein A and related proteins